MRTLIAVALLVLMQCANAALPPQAHSHTAKHSQSPAIATNQQSPVSDLRGTEQSPLVVKTVPLPKSPDEAANETKDRAEKASTDTWTIRLALITAAILGLQLIVFGIQAWAFFVQAGKLRETVEVTREANQRQAGEMLESLRIARETLVFTHRPRLHVRNVVVRQPTPIHAPAPEVFQNGCLVQGQLYVSNIGGTRATITGVGCWVEWMRVEALPMERPYEGLNPNVAIENAVLNAGESLPIPFQSGKLMGTESPLVRDCSNNWKLYVMGWIEYRDEVGAGRRTEFCRQWKMPERHFVSVTNTDYEFEH